MIQITNRKVRWRDNEIYFTNILGIYKKTYRFICKYSIFWQTIYHLVLPPLALITAFIRWGMLARRTSIISKDTSSHALWMVLTNSSLFCGSSSFWIVSFKTIFQDHLSSYPRPFELRTGASTLTNLSEFFSSSWCYAHQNPKEAMNPSNSTICAKLQAQETKPLELQLLTKNTHTMYPQATTLLEQSMFFVERLLEIHIWSSNSQKFEVCWLKKNGCCLHGVGATNTTWSAINAIWFFLDTWLKFAY